MKYRVAYRHPGSNEVHQLRKTYTNLREAESAADDYNIGEPCLHHFVKPIEEGAEND